MSEGTPQIGPSDLEHRSDGVTGVMVGVQHVSRAAEQLVVFSQLLQHKELLFASFCTRQ